MDRIFRFLFFSPSLTGRAGFERKNLAARNWGQSLFSQFLLESAEILPAKKVTVSNFASDFRLGRDFAGGVRKPEGGLTAWKRCVIISGQVLPWERVVTIL